MISRQSLLRLSRDLDEMRRLSAQLDGRDVGGMTGEALTSSQSHFRADLEDASGQGAGGWTICARRTWNCWRPEHDCRRSIVTAHRGWCHSSRAPRS